MAAFLIPQEETVTGFACSSEVPEAATFHKQATCKHERLSKPETTDKVINGVAIRVTRVSCLDCEKLIAETLEVL